MRNRFFVFDTNGNLIWSLTLSKNGFIDYTPIICDMNSDGIPEVLCIYVDYTKKHTAILTIDVKKKRIKLEFVGNAPIIPIRALSVFDCDCDHFLETLILGPFHICIFDFNDKIVLQTHVGTTSYYSPYSVIILNNTNGKNEFLFTTRRCICAFAFPENYKPSLIEKFYAIKEIMISIIGFCIAIGLFFCILYLFSSSLNQNISSRKNIKAYGTFKTSNEFLNML